MKLLELESKLRAMFKTHYNLTDKELKAFKLRAVPKGKYGDVCFKMPESITDTDKCLQTIVNYCLRPPL